MTPARVARICHADLGAGSDGILVIDGDGRRADPEPRRSRRRVLRKRLAHRRQAHRRPRRAPRARARDAARRDRRHGRRPGGHDRRRPGYPRRARPPAERRRRRPLRPTRSSSREPALRDRGGRRRRPRPAGRRRADRAPPVVPEPRERRVLPAASPSGEIRMRVWERGAGETLSSGSGSSAAAVAAVVAGRARSPVTVHTDGGDLRRRGLRRPRTSGCPGPSSTSATGCSRPSSSPGWSGCDQAVAPDRAAAAVPLRRARAKGRRAPPRGRRRDLAGHRRPRSPRAPTCSSRRRAAGSATRRRISTRRTAGSRRSARRWRGSTAAASGWSSTPTARCSPARRQGGRGARLLRDARPRRRVPGGRSRLSGLHVGDAARRRRAAPDAAHGREPLPARSRRHRPRRHRPGEPALLQLPEQPHRRRGRGRLLRPARSLRRRSGRAGRPRQRLLRDHVRRLRRAELPRLAGGTRCRHRDVLALEGLQHDRLARGSRRRERRHDRRAPQAEDERRLRPVRRDPARRGARPRASRATRTWPTCATSIAAGATW